MPCQILHYFARYTLADGRVSGLPGWNFTDWCYNPGWMLGVPQPAQDGATSILDLQLLLAYQLLGDIEQHMGNTFMAQKYAASAERLAKAVQQSYWVADRGLYANNTDRRQFAQHAQALAILTGLVEGEQARVLAEKTLTHHLLPLLSPSGFGKGRFGQRLSVVARQVAREYGQRSDYLG